LIDGEQQMKAVILAGGYGVRLRPLTYTKPKPMLTLAGKPVLHHIINFLAQSGFEEIIITSNYLREHIENYFGDGEDFGVRLRYPIELKPLGTAGCVKNIEDSLKDDAFVVIQGDNITDLDLRNAIEFHRENDGLATILLVPVEDPSEFGIAQLNGNSRITRFAEKPRREQVFSNLANTGLYIIDPQALKYIPSRKPFDFSKDLFPRLMKTRERLIGYKATGTWFDIGRLEDYLSANRWMLNRMMETEEKETFESEAIIEGPVYMGDNVEIEPGVKIYGPTLIGDNTLVGSKTVILSSTTIGPNVETGREAKIDGSIIYENTEIGHESYLAQCVVGENCEIGSRTVLGMGTMIGASCQIGSGTTITPNTRIWPKKIIQKNSTIRGTIK